MILVTGSTGFLGKHIVRTLLEKGEEVRLLVRNSKKRKLPWGSLVDIVDGDVNDIMAVYKAVEGVDKVIHAAAIVSFWAKRKAETLKINVDGTDNIVNACLEHGVSKLVHISSIAALGKHNQEDQLIDEETPWKPPKNISPYAQSKYLAELKVYKGIAEGLDAQIVNPGLILGPDSDWTQGTPKFFTIMDKGLQFFNRGLSGVVSVHDVAEVVAMLLDKKVDSGERYVMVAENLEQKDLFGKIATTLGKNPPRYGLPAWLSMMVGYISSFLAFLQNKEPLINPATMRSSISRYRYDGKKVTELGFSYSPIDILIEETAKSYLSAKKEPA